MSKIIVFILAGHFSSLMAIALQDPAIVVVPDTQLSYYTRYSDEICQFPEVADSEFQWIEDNRASLSAWLHLGDIVHLNDRLEEWECASDSVSLVSPSLPCALAVGNHDLVHPRDTTNFNAYFPSARFESQPWYGGHFGSLNDNHFIAFTDQGQDFVVVALAWNPVDEAYDWAKSIFESYQDHFGILVQHAYIRSDKSWYPQGLKTHSHLQDVSNLRLIFCGHDIEGYPGPNPGVLAESVVTEFIEGKPRYIILSNYQNIWPGGAVWLRINRFTNNMRRLEVSTYSPWLDESRTGSDSDFSLNLGVRGDVNTDGSVNIHDLLSLLTTWGDCVNCLQDVNGDGAVGVLDLLALLGNIRRFLRGFACLLIFESNRSMVAALITNSR